jgi:hypothetical protein
MDRQSQNNGWLTFLEHYGWVIIILVAFLFGELLTFFTQLTGWPKTDALMGDPFKVARLWQIMSTS